MKGSFLDRRLDSFGTEFAGSSLGCLAADRIYAFVRLHI